MASIHSTQNINAILVLTGKCMPQNEIMTFVLSINQTPFLAHKSHAMYINSIWPQTHWNGWNELASGQLLYDELCLLWGRRCIPAIIRRSAKTDCVVECTLCIAPCQRLPVADKQRFHRRSGACVRLISTLLIAIYADCGGHRDKW